VAQISHHDEFGFNRLGAGMRHRAASAIMVKHEPWFTVLSIEGLCQDIVRTGDDLQRLAQIVTGPRQQRR
jgi:hypothetical protein